MSQNEIDKEGSQMDKENDPLLPEILDLLGEEESGKRISSDVIHPAISRRWEGILKLGLSPENASILRKNYPPPENCRLVGAPKLNLEVAATITE
ncbi:hypothetical protein NQ314_019955 [Rhamnusium bicolor]|uniref:Uncharacterized protein n=1 Tax=Rhamnusium bicolor TaxID=1586634 RepID=A0AAV8WMY4_9CUCU|nr:hypothetical protein NQ314_019955 [Rhamnusium bicolor]